MVTRLVLLALLIFPTASIAQTPPVSDKPEVKVGDTWMYKQVDMLTNEVREESTIEVVSIDAEQIKTRSVRSGREQEEIFDTQWNSKLVDGRAFVPYRSVLEFPLAIGKAWEKPVTYPNRQGDAKITATMKGTVRGWESITVPAGTFQAQKITLTESYYNDRTGTSAGSRGGGVGQWTVWYAPTAKRAVRFEYQEGRNRVRTELVQLKLN
jgi:hypothetical protein